MVYFDEIQFIFNQEKDYKWDPYHKGLFKLLMYVVFC